MPVQFANVDWEKEEVKAKTGNSKRKEQRVRQIHVLWYQVALFSHHFSRAFLPSRQKRRQNESKAKNRKDVDDANRFFQFLFSLEETELRVLLKDSVHAFAFFMIVYGFADDEKNVDAFVQGDMRAETLRRSDILMVLEWKDAFVADGLYRKQPSSSAESRNDSPERTVRQ